MRLAVASLLVVTGCGGERAVAPSRSIEGAVAAGAPGDAYLFLYAPGEGPPQLPGEPLHLTAVPAVRRSSGDGRFVFADVPDGAYRLWGFIDTDRNLRIDDPLLAQPGAGDLPLLALEVTHDGGTVLPEPLTVGTAITADPPAFAVEGAEEEEIIPDLPLSPVTFSVVSTEVARIGGGGFEVSLVDADGDGAPDDADGDALPDLSPQLFLRFLPRPGQTVPLDERGRPAEILVPLRYLPGAFFAALGGDPDARVRTASLTVTMIPQAIAVFRGEGGRRFTSTLEAIPIGAYELLIVTEAGQVWTVPNALAGAVPSQGIRFTVVHGS